MVHRAPDSRLLTNLIAHEKEYAKHLAALFPLSHAALASLSAYAAASPAQPTAALVDILASADDALQRYTHAVDAWREQLAALKQLEDDLAAVLRDRDILCVPASPALCLLTLPSVTRLIKASKSTRDPHRASRLVTGPASASASSLPSTNSTVAAPTGPASTNARLAHAQAELQACEAHLVTKERELDARRISIARDGLGARCRALVDCGWVWGELGKQGLKALGANGTLAGAWVECVVCYANRTPSPETVVCDPTSSRCHVRIRQLVAHPFPERLSNRSMLRRDQPRERRDQDQTPSSGNPHPPARTRHPRAGIPPRAASSKWSSNTADTTRSRSHACTRAKTADQTGPPTALSAHRRSL
jgi:hypothetical protein